MQVKLLLVFVFYTNAYFDVDSLFRYLVYEFHINLYIYIYHRFIVLFPMGLDFLFITFLL